jgi:hypothetical protein
MRASGSSSFAPVLALVREPLDVIEGRRWLFLVARRSDVFRPVRDVFGDILDVEEGVRALKTLFLEERRSGMEE